MADQAHEWTDEQIEALQRKFERTYGTAAKEMRKKLDGYLGDFEKANAEWKAAVKSGNATSELYEAWLKSQATRKRYLVDMSETLARDATRTNELAANLINDTIPSVYAENANYAAFGIEKAIGRDTHSFDLYDESTVRRLMAMGDDEQVIKEVILPPEEPDPPLRTLRKVNIDKAKDVRWNRQHFTSAITQSILQGESIPSAAKRLREVLNMDQRMAVRAARTAMTSAENAGRIDSYQRAERIGITLEQEWMATLDERTRYSHRELDGQHVPVGEKFVIKSSGHEIEFPGDPKAHPSEVWNCRCTLVAWLPDIEKEDNARWSRLPEGMTYDDWKAGKKAEKKRNESIDLANVTGKKPKPWDDSPEDYYLPKATRERLDYIESLHSYDDFKAYFNDRGIKLTTDLDVLRNERSGDDIKAVREECQKIAVAVDAYKEVFGTDALSKLKRINLYDETLDTRAAYHFNVIGEDDPLAGTIRFRQWNDDGRTIFHELAHAFQDSQAARGEDAVTFSERMTKQAGLDRSFSAYAGASSDTYEAERFADAFGYGFANGNESGLSFILNVMNELAKKKRK